MNPTDLQWSLEFWRWIPATWQVIATLLGAAGTAFFAWRTYLLQRKLAELQYAPVLQIEPLGRPEAGHVSSKSRYIYVGVVWRISILNPGDIPVAVERIDIEVTPAFGRKTRTSVGKLCAILSDSGEALPRALVVSPHNHQAVTVVLYDKGVTQLLAQLFDGQQRFTMTAMAYQYRPLADKLKAGYIELESEPFVLPTEFGAAVDLQPLH